MCEVEIGHRSRDEHVGLLRSVEQLDLVHFGVVQKLTVELGHRYRLLTVAGSQTGSGSYQRLWFVVVDYGLLVVR